MKGFFLNLYVDFSRFFRRSAWISILFGLSIILGIVFGIFAVNSGVSFNSVLNTNNKLIFEYMSGAAGSASIFFNKLLEFVFILALVFIFTLSIYSSFLAFLFVGYQAFLLVLVCSSIIGLYDFVGILNVIVVLIPSNILFFAVLYFLVGFSVLRAFDAHRFGLKLGVSVKYSNYLVSVVLCAICALIISFIFAFVLPALLKCFLLVAY